MRFYQEMRIYRFRRKVTLGFFQKEKNFNFNIKFDKVPKIIELCGKRLSVNISL